MSTAFTQSQTNQHLETLRPVISESKTTVKWLVITRTDAGLLGALSSAFSGESAAMLQISDEQWNADSDELHEAVEWALQQGEIDHLVFAGCGTQDGEQGYVVTADQKEPFASRYDRLVAGIQKRNRLDRACQESFASQFQQLNDLPIVNDRRVSGDLKVYGVFYRAESGVFLSYDLESGSYRPLFS